MDSSMVIILLALFYIFRKKIKITKQTREKLVILFYANLILICALSFYVDEKYDAKNPQ
tara:strand:- start:255 stop:431 length:177 start_codon:yes stop_codon:yes gene_type:complete